jgi:hypothetical protein
MYNDQRKVGLPYQRKDSRPVRAAAADSPDRPGAVEGIGGGRTRENRVPLLEAVGGGGRGAEPEKGKMRRRIWEYSFFYGGSTGLSHFSTEKCTRALLKKKHI